MKTKTTTILAPEGRHNEAHEVDIRTADGHLKSNLLRRMIQAFGDRLRIPSSLTLEILESRLQLKKIAKRRTRQRDALAEEAKYLLLTIVKIRSGEYEGGVDIEKEFDKIKRQLED